MELNLAQIARMCDGVLAKEAFTKDDGDKQDMAPVAAMAESVIVHRVIINSKLATSGDLFVAIKGDKHDGHDFVADLLMPKKHSCKPNYSHLQADSNIVANFQNILSGDKRAHYIAGAIVNKDFPLSHPSLIRVNDTTEALGILASRYRDLFVHTPIVAITGSNGKTTVKNMLKSICEVHFGAVNVLATEGTLNNHWGMPLTLLKLHKQHQVAILEMGMNHKGELDYLTRLAKPTVAIINNVMWAHAGFFTGLADIANAKGEIYNSLQSENTACINFDSEFAFTWYNELISRGVNIYAFAKAKTPLARQDLSTQSTANNNSPQIKCYIQKSDDCGNLTIYTPLGLMHTKLSLLGRHNYLNALSATVLALNVGCSLDSISVGLALYNGYARRLERKLAFNGATLVDDSYNANPDSLKAAISAIKSLPAPYWLLLGDLGELGEFASVLHQEVGAFARDNGINVFLSVGALANIAGKEFSQGSQGSQGSKGQHVHFANNEAAISYCRTHLPKQGTLLIKGSKATLLSDVADALSLSRNNCT